MRLESSIKNLKFAIIGQFLGIVVSFVGRMVFVNILNEEYLGINGLFSNILSMLSLVELGIGPAIVFSLYKPLAENDTSKINTLMHLYKKAYILIGMVIGSLGILITPFIHILIKDMPDIDNIKLIYILFVLNSAISYFYAYKRNLIIADQKKYIATFYRYSFFVLLNLVQIAVLTISKNFILFLLVQISITIAENIVVSKRADKIYPYLKNSTIEPLDSETKGTIIKNIKAMIMHKVGSIIVMSTDNLIISSYVGVVWVGVYSNYLLIINALNAVLIQFFQAIVASIGNLVAREDIKKAKEVYDVVFFMNFWLYGFSSIALICLFNPFISIWLGEKYLLNIKLVLLIVISFYLTGMRQGTMIFRDALGLYWQDRYKAILEAGINLIVSLILVQHIGFAGVILGTIISTLTTCTWMEPCILHKYGFELSSKSYFLNYIKYTLTVLVVGIITFELVIIIDSITLISFVLKAVICLVVPNISFMVLYSKTREFKYLWNIVENKVLNFKGSIFFRR